jgi:hypothetical protein
VGGEKSAARAINFAESSPDIFVRSFSAPCTEKGGRLYCFVAGELDQRRTRLGPVVMAK